MRKLLFVYLLFFSTLLLANASLDTFINAQMQIEKELMNSDISSEKKEKITANQKLSYQNFFLDYASHKKEILKEEESPYRNMIYKLKIRQASNKKIGYKTAAKRDEVLIYAYSIKEAIRSSLNKVLRFTSNESEKFYQDKIADIIVKHFTEYTPLDPNKYIDAESNNSSSPKIKALKNALKDVSALESVANTFSAAVVDNASNIYHVSNLSDSKMYTKLNRINHSDLGQKINPYLSKMNLDLAQVTVIFSIIIFIFLLQLSIKSFVNRYLRHRNVKEEDIDYIFTHITKIFIILTSLMVIHMIIVVILGFDTKLINLARLFGSIYVILIAIILYRITNTLAYLKIEKMKKRGALRDEVINLSIKGVNAIIILFALIALLKIFGVDLTTVLSGLGIAGAAVAFAAKDTIANIFGSIAILAGDIFEQGDWIETESVDGTVVEIGLRATTVRTFDNALISVPNFELSNKGVKNWSRRNVGRRIKLTIGVTYESDFDDIRQAVEDIRDMLRQHPGIANEHTSYLNPIREAKLVSAEDFKGIKRTTLVYLDEFSDSSINILVYCFSRTVVWNEWLEVKEDVLYQIADILKKNHLDFAYPSLTIHKGKELEEKVQSSLSNL